MTNFLLLKLVGIHHSTFPRSQQGLGRFPAGRGDGPPRGAGEWFRLVRSLAGVAAAFLTEPGAGDA
jgi:hypothetical protein